MMRSHRKSRGVSLVECLVAMLVLTVGVLAAARCLSVAYGSQKNSIRLSLATSIAQNAMEKIRSEPFMERNITEPLTTLLITDEDELSAAVKARIQSDILPHFPGGQATITVVAAPTSLGSQVILNKLLLVTIDISWQGGRAEPEHFVLTSLISNRVSHKGS